MYDKNQLEQYYRNGEPCGKGYTWNDGTFKTQYTVISEEKYNELSSLQEKGRLNETIEEGLSDSIRYGYGFYGSRVFIDEDCNHILAIECGATCD